MREKELCLMSRLKELGRAAVAFSGGADSALLACSAARALGPQAFAVTIWSPLLSQKDRDEIMSFTEKYDIPLIRVDFDETEDAEFRENGSERCYRCKALRLKKLEETAKEWDIPWILDGSNVDDLDDYRPGMRALRESKMTLSPLLECGFTKDNVRALSRLYGLPTAAKPAAACLASRIPTGVRIEKDFLALIDKGEDILRAHLPVNAQIRLRFDGRNAKIETDRENAAGLSAVFGMLEKEFLALGMTSVTIAEGGYKMGGVSFRG